MNAGLSYTAAPEKVRVFLVAHLAEAHTTWHFKPELGS